MNCLYVPTVYKMIPLDIDDRINFFAPFLSVILEFTVFCSGLHCIWWESYDSYLFPGWLQDLSLSLIFSVLWFYMYIFFLDCSELLGHVVCCLLLIWENSQTLLLPIIFCPFLFLFFFLLLNYIYASPLDLGQQRCILFVVLVACLFYFLCLSFHFSLDKL